MEVSSSILISGEWQYTSTYHLYPIMVNRSRTSVTCGLNKGRGSKFFVDSLIRQETPEDGWRIYQRKRYEYNNKNEDNGPKILSNKN